MGTPPIPPPTPPNAPPDNMYVRDLQGTRPHLGSLICERTPHRSVSNGSCSYREPICCERPLRTYYLPPCLVNPTSYQEHVVC